MIPGIRSVLLAICTSSAAAMPLWGQPIFRTVESVETMVGNASRVVVGRVTRIDNVHDIPGPRGWSSVMTVEEMLKGERAQQLSLSLPVSEPKLAQWRQNGTRLLVAISRDTAAPNVVIDLGADDLAVLTADFVVLRDSASVIRTVQDAIRQLPPGSDHLDSFSLTVPYTLIGGTSPWLRLRVPIDPRLEQRAHAMLRGGWESRRDEAVDALRHFKSDANIHLLTALLADTALAFLSRAEENMGHEIRVYVVRQKAYEVLKAWGLAPPEPVLRVETYKPEVVELVDLSNKSITAAELTGLRAFVNLRKLVLTNARLPEGAFEHIAALAGLRELTVSGSNVTDADLGILSGLTMLEALDLIGTGITDAGLRTIAEFSALETVYLAHTHVTASGIDELRRRRPDLTITR